MGYAARIFALIAASQAGADGASLRVLFIGNSLTAANDVPALVEGLGKANGERIMTRTVAFPNYSLEDHWNQGDARRIIAEGGWSFVVLQQGPSALAESRVLLVDYAKRFAAEAKRAGAKTALFMVWPESSRAAAFDGVKLSYQKAAREIGGIFLPAGEAWRIAWSRKPDLQLYGTDGFHPTALGSYLAALVIYQGLTGRGPARTPGMPALDADAKILREAASRALAQTAK
jgi:hypothetical protein